MMYSKTLFTRSAAASLHPTYTFPCFQAAAIQSVARTKTRGCLRLENTGWSEDRRSTVIIHRIWSDPFRIVGPGDLRRRENKFSLQILSKKKIPQSEWSSFKTVGFLVKLSLTQTHSVPVITGRKAVRITEYRSKDTEVPVQLGILLRIHPLISLNYELRSWEDSWKSDEQVLLIEISYQCLYGPIARNDSDLPTGRLGRKSGHVSIQSYRFISWSLWSAAACETPISLTLTGDKRNVDMSVDSSERCFVPASIKISGVGNGIELKSTKGGAIPLDGRSTWWSLNSLRPLDPGRSKE
jgi:hypothetical protein